MRVFTEAILPILLYCGPIPWALGAFAVVRWSGKPGSFQRTFVAMTVVHILAFMPFLIALMMGWPDVLYGLTLPAITGVITAPVGLILFLLITLDVTGSLSWLDER